MNIIKTIAISLSIILVGCTNTPNINELNNAHYGEFPGNYQDLIKSQINGRLKDPYSAQYEFSKPYKAWCQSGFNTFYGWLVPFSLNAKNSYGGYTGSKTFAYLIVDGMARDFTSPYQVGGCGKV